MALIAADTCERILDHSISAEVGTHRLYVVGHEGGPLDDLLPTVAALAAHLADTRAPGCLRRIALRTGSDRQQEVILASSLVSLYGCWKALSRPRAHA
ncbi:hypothetical protein [Micromonospora sp. DT62]|uniref:hypothetical protein n=1 Tax=Micromonospora sp. DT62 TaxID=3416521 RepID=UPI003CE9B0AC